MAPRTLGGIALLAVVVVTGVTLVRMPGCRAARTIPGIHTDLVRMPEGFEIGLFTDEVPGARSLALGAKGTVFVGTRPQGKVYAVIDADGDGRAERVHVVAKGLRSPNGVAFRDGALYVAEISRILRLDGIEGRLEDPPEPVVLYDGFPTEEHHGWKFIAFGPDGLLYVPVGAPGNHVLRTDDRRFASITRLRPDDTGVEVFAEGVRNTVGFDWHPGTGELWFTDNGQDWMGEDRPPDELNRAPAPGLHFGYPSWHGADLEDGTYGDRMAKDAFVPPEIALGPHVAALGMRFYTGAMFPAEYRGAIFIAEHGSWNRRKPVGYRVTVVRFREGRAASYEPFAEGWLQDDGAWGRPVDVLVMPDGALLVSDDRSGAIYRITHRG